MNFIVDRFGDKYSKHEAVWRILLVPKIARRFVRLAFSWALLNTWTNQLKLYMIWNRFVASQMTAVFDTMNVPFRSKWGFNIQRWESGKVWRLLAIYNDSNLKNKMLPDMVEGDIVKQVNKRSNALQPPARYSETAVKTLEENGVGRLQPMLKRLRPFKNAIMWSW